jgi:non-heme chloroperoxidase
MENVSHFGKVAVRESGIGAPLVFIHGFPSSGRVWHRQFNSSLSESFAMMALDMPGFGDSVFFGEPTTFACAEIVKDFLDGRKLESVVLVGWSFGAGVVMKYCEQFGTHRIAGIALVDDCPLLLPSRDWLAGVHTPFSAEEFAQWARDWADNRPRLARRLSETEFAEPVNHEEDIALLVDDALRADPRAIGFLRDVATQDFRPSLSRLTTPALLLYGRHSNMTTLTTAKYMDEIIPDGRLHLFDHSGHNPMLEEPDKFNRLLGAFAASLSSLSDDVREGVET